MARPIENTEKVSTFIPKDTLEALKKHAKENGMTISGLIRFLIVQELKK